MSEAAHIQPFPRGTVVAAAGLIGLTIVAAGVGRLADIGVTRMPAAAPVQSRVLHFADRTDGGVEVTDSEGRVVEIMPGGTNGFARGALRGLARERRRSDIGAEPPFVLTRWSDGRLSLEDPTTKRLINLEAFGTTNSAVFARLLTGEGRP